ncbi:MAG: modA3 [Proteobacteria bacterium]|nr:modA3 [Pseudomonadota bacterium]
MRAENKSLIRTCLRGLLVSVLAGFATLSVAQESVLVAGGAGYKRPIDEMANGFEAASKIKVERIYGHMGQVLQQTRASGKVAVVFGEQDVLEKAEQVSFAKYLPLGEGRLVVAWSKGKTLKAPADVAGEGFPRIAVADVKQAIFGKAAIEYLQRAGLFPAVEKRLLTVSTVPQVSAYLISGEVDAGFINLTEALSIRDKIGGYLEIPAGSYTPIHITAALVAGQDTAPVRALVDYLQTPAAHEILKRYGL